MGLTFQEQLKVHILYCLFDLVESCTYSD